MRATGILIRRGNTVRRKASAEGIRASGIARAELFVTTKVTEENAREADFLRSAETSLKALGLDYVDLLLVHWPNPNVPRAETLGALAKAKRSGMARHIGVSNFTLAMLDEAVALCAEPLVANQVEYHAYLNQDKMLAACRRHGLILTAYCPVARGELLNDPVITAIAQGQGQERRPGGAALRHPASRAVAAVPRAFEPAHVEQNIDIFDFSLSDDEMGQISALRARNVRIANPPERAPVWDAA